MMEFVSVFGFLDSASIMALAASSAFSSAVCWLGTTGATFRGLGITSDRLGRMSDSIKDLDALVPTDKRVQLDGVVYTLPGDLPLEIYLRVNKAGALEDDDEQKALDEMIGAMVDLFSHSSKGKPTYDNVRDRVDAALRSRGIRFNTALLQNIYGEIEEPKASDENPPS